MAASSVNEGLAVLGQFVADVGSRREYRRGRTAIPIPLDSELRLSNAWLCFESLSLSKWAVVRHSIDEIATRVLSDYSARMASYAVRLGSTEPVHHGLMALVIDDNKMDPRDVVTALCLLYDASLRAGGNPEAQIREVSRFATEERSRLLISYLEDPQACHDIEEMGFSARDTADGFHYLWIG